MTIKIYFNAKCSMARGTLTLLQEKGITPEIIEYLIDTPTQATLSKLISDAGLTVREAIRAKEPVYAELGLDDPAKTDAQLLAAMVAHPILINRPFVVTPIGTRLCRPPETLFEILPA
ncbi:MAG: arsC [Herbaspirillum sp.]|jgi:arsenate reductase|nr:arsC [Herbaspirillum sp.]